MRPIVLLLVLILMNTEARKTYPGFTAFDNNKGEYFKVTGPILGKVKITVSKLPPYKTSDTLSYYAEFIPTETVNSVYFKGQVLYDDFILWSEDGTNNFCSQLEGNKNNECPWKAGVKYWANGTQNLGTLGSLAGPYTINAYAFTVDPKGKHVKLFGVKAAIMLNY